MYSIYVLWRQASPEGNSINPKIIREGNVITLSNLNQTTNSFWVELKAMKVFHMIENGSSKSMQPSFGFSDFSMKIILKRNMVFTPL